MIAFDLSCCATQVGKRTPFQGVDPRVRAPCAVQKHNAMGTIIVSFDKPYYNDIKCIRAYMSVDGGRWKKAEGSPYKIEQCTGHANRISLPEIEAPLRSIVRLRFEYVFKDGRKEKHGWGWSCDERESNRHQINLQQF